MPLTTTALWPDLVAGKKAKASEVEAKFDWLEGSLFPHNSGNATNNAYDIGTSTYNFRTGYFGTSVYTPALNPTTTASGVAIGKDTANANTCLDLSAMPKAFYMPLLTTTQRDALTPAEGMLIYNTTNTRAERYEGGQWLAMNNPIGFKEKVYNASINSNTYTDLLNVTGSGRLISAIWNSTSGGTGSTQTVSLIIDGTTYGISFLNTTTVMYVGLDNIGTANEFTYTISPHIIDISFKNSLQIQTRNSGNGTPHAAGVTYELS